VFRADPQEDGIWTTEHRGRHDRSDLRDPSDLTDAEGALAAALILPPSRDGNKRTVDVREVLSGIMSILGTGCQWAALPRELPLRSTVNSNFLLRTSVRVMAGKLCQSTI